MGLQDISIRLKLYSLTIGGVLGTLLALGVLFLLMQSSTGTLSRTLKLVMDGDTRLFELINDVASSQGLLQQINREKDAEIIETLATGYVDTIAAVDKRIQEDFPAEQEPCRQIWMRLRSVNQSALDMALKGQQAMALQLLASESNPLFEKLLAEIEVHRKDVHQDQSAAMERSTHQVNTMLAVFAAAMAGMFIALLFFGLYISRSITRPIGATADMLKLIAQGQGDLTRRLAVTSRDEVGGLAHWFNEFISQLEGIIHRIKTSAVEADESTQQVSAESQGLAKSTQEQAAAVEEVAATIEQMASLIKENAHNAAQGLDVTTKTVLQANESEQLAQDLMAAMQEVLDASRRIGDIIATVNEVAFQTNLLALNAAVEAARAGEHGKGFSVVADEVRALAGRSSEAARQIKALIQETMDKVARSDTMVSRSSASLREIRDSIAALSQRMQEIAASSAEQAGGVESVNKAISQIDTMTQQNASTVEQLAAMAENLSLVSSNLARTVERFTVGQDKDE